MSLEIVKTGIMAIETTHKIAFAFGIKEICIMNTEKQNMPVMILRSQNDEINGFFTQQIPHHSNELANSKRAIYDIEDEDQIIE